VPLKCVRVVPQLRGFTAFPGLLEANGLLPLHSYPCHRHDFVQPCSSRTDILNAVEKE